MNYMNDKKVTTAATFLAVVISTLMLVAPALANHSSSAEWKETGGLSYKVGANEDMVTSITVTNDTGDSIENIQIVAGINPQPTGTSSEGSEFWTDNTSNRMDSTVSQFVEAGTTETIYLERTPVNTVVDLYDADGNMIVENYTATVIDANTGEVDISNTGSDPDNFTVEKVEYTLTTTPAQNLFIPEGTEVTLKTSNLTVDMIENTEFIVPEGENVYNVNASENVTLREDGTVYVPDTGYTMNLRPEDNVTPIDGKLEFLLPDVRVRLLEDTSFVGTDDSQNVSLPENTEFKILDNHTPVTVNFGTETDNLEITDKVNDVVSSWVLGADNLMKAAETIPITTPDGYEQNLSEDSKIELNKYENLIVQEGTKFSTSGAPAQDIKIWAGSDVVRKKDSELELVNLDDFTQKPSGWMGQAYTSHPVHNLDYAEVVAEDSDDYLDSGNSVDIPISLQTAATTDNKQVYVRTTDTEGTTRITQMVLEVDADAPEVEDLSVSPEWANENTNVDITIEMSETLGAAPDVAVKENNGEYSSISVEASQDNTVYTGVYTTGDNIDRDGVATILVENFEDAVGNEQTTAYENDSLLNIDRVAPQKPDLSSIFGWPVDELPSTDGTQTSVSGYLWEGTAKDNYRGDANEDLTDGTVELKYNGQWHSVSPDDSGYWNSEVDIDDGMYEIGVKYIDRSGNESEENLENLTVDSTAPSITVTSDMEDGDYIADNQPTIELSIEDSLLGIENKVGTYHSNETPEYEDNTGYMVLLASPDFADEVSADNFLAQLDAVTTKSVSYYDLDDEMHYGFEWYSLANSMTFDNNNNEVTFESALENSKAGGIELEEETYALYVIAGDNLQTNMESLEFTVDITDPDLGTYDRYVEDVDGERLWGGGTTSTDTWTWSGTADEEGSTIVLTNADGDELGSAEVDDDKEWEIEVTFNEDGRRNIFLQEIDRAGNTSEEERWGSITIDTTKPSIVWDEDTKALDGTETSETSIDVGATVTDAVADSHELSVSLSSPDYDVPEGGITLGEDGSLTNDVPLTEGPNTIKITAVDQANNVATASIKVTRTVAPWAMYATIAAIIAIILAALAILRRQ